MIADERSAADAANKIARALETDGAHPAKVFALRHCGFLITDTNASSFSVDEVVAWETALARWFAMHPDSPPLTG